VFPSVPVTFWNCALLVGVAVIGVGERIACGNPNQIRRLAMVFAIFGAIILGFALIEGLPHNLAKRAAGPIPKSQYLGFALLAGIISLAWALFSWKRGKLYDYFGGAVFLTKSPGKFWFYFVAFLSTGIGIMIICFLEMALT
jgi:hypothetical protein